MKYEFLILHPSAFIPTRSPGEVRRNKRSITLSFIAKKVLDDTGPTEKRKHGVGNTPMQGPASRRIADPGQNLRLPQQTFNFEPHIFTCQRANKIPSNTGEIPLHQQRANSFEFDFYLLSPTARQ